MTTTIAGQLVWILGNLLLFAGLSLALNPRTFEDKHIIAAVLITAAVMCYTAF